MNSALLTLNGQPCTTYDVFPIAVDTVCRRVLGAALTSARELLGSREPVCDSLHPQHTNLQIYNAGGSTEVVLQTIRPSLAARVVVMSNSYVVIITEDKLVCVLLGEWDR